MRREPELTTVSSKGQVVIPQYLRYRLGLKPKTRLLVFGKRDTIVLKKMKIPETNLDKIFKSVDMGLGKYKPLSSAGIQKEIEAYRRKKRKNQ